jgi:uncharacterized Rmd1/YagE family protein
MNQPDLYEDNERGEVLFDPANAKDSNKDKVKEKPARNSTGVGWFVIFLVLLIVVLVILWKVKGS